MEQPAAGWRPIGTVLVHQGLITEADLEAALAEQTQSGRRLGEILIASGRITWLALAHAIAEQAQDLEREISSSRPRQAGKAPPPAAPVREAAAEDRLSTVETLLKERQRAFLELVSVTEKLRNTVARLQDELSARDAEIQRLRAERAAI